MTTTTAPDLTRTCQPASFTTAGLLTVLETAWDTIRTRHPEVPAAVLIVGSGSPANAKASMKWGHFADLRWQHGDTQLPEVLVSGEGLARTPTEVLVTLLHEATHGLAATRGIADTSRQGRYHNKKFAKLAAELGLEARKDDKLGYSPCTLTDRAAAEYADTLTGLSAALKAFRHPETFVPKQRTNNNNGVTAECACPRKIRLSDTAFEKGPIVCAVCESPFLPGDIDPDSYDYPRFATAAALSATTYVMGTCELCGTSHVPVWRPEGVDPRAPQPICIDSQACEARCGFGPDSEDPMVFYDPTGTRYGIPTYPYKMAPAGLFTVRQLRAQGKRPGGQPVAAQLMWRKGKRVAYLYHLNLAAPKRTATPAQLAALDKALLARRTCRTCNQVQPYYIPRRTGACLDCAPGGPR
jgi:hypothetical protein